MAKIDVSKIDGYESMSAEQKLEALQGFEFNVPSPDYSNHVEKKMFDKVASELSAAKKEKNALMSEEQRKAQEAQEKYEAIMEENANLRKEKQVATFVSKGYSSELAAKKVEALQSGNVDALAEIEDQFLADYRKSIEKTLVNATPPPANGSSGKQEDFSKMTLTEKAKLKASNPELYKQLTGGN